MKKILLTFGIVLLTSSASAQMSVRTAGCFNKAATEVEYAACLKEEMAVLEKKYNDVIEQVTARMRTIDRQQKDKKASQAFAAANKSFQAYVKDECDMIEDTASGTDRGSAAALACRINLTRLRLGVLHHQFISAQ